MKTTNKRVLPVMLAGLLQLMPFLRSALPAIQFAESPTGCLILRWVAGGVAFFGYHAVSSASSIAISPSVATIGTPYAGTLTYSGSESGEVYSMSYNGVCLGSTALAPGLTITYSGGHTASISGTPTGSSNNLTVTVRVTDGSGCSGGLSDTRSTGFTIQAAGSGPSAPIITVPPQSLVSQVGADALFSGGATGNPTPQYFWKQGITVIPGATTNNLLLPAVQLTNAGVYTMVASNSQGQTPAACYLSVALTPGSNNLAFQFTNYVVAGTPVTMNSFLTNAPAGVTTYAWQYNHVNTGITTSNLSLSGSQTIPTKSGIYSINFNSSVGATQVVSNQAYDSYWLFGYLPVVTNQPSPVTVGSGSNATFNVTLAGSSFATVLWYQNTTNLVAVQTNLSQAYNPSTVTATTNFSLTLSNVTQANAGNYTVVVTNFWGSTTSSPALLTVNSALSVSAPQGQTNYAGKNVSFSVTASGTPPFGYQWQLGGLNLANASPFSGVNTNTLSIAPAAVSNSGNYAVIVTNTSGSVTSSVAALFIVSVPTFGISPSTTNMILNAAGGVPGSQYIVQYSTNLDNTNGWVAIYTNTVPPNGVINFTDTNSSNSGLGYYRVQFP